MLIRTRLESRLPHNTNLTSWKRNLVLSLRCHFVFVHGYLTRCALESPGNLKRSQGQILSVLIKPKCQTVGFSHQHFLKVPRQFPCEAGHGRASPTGRGPPFPAPASALTPSYLTQEFVHSVLLSSSAIFTFRGTTWWNDSMENRNGRASRGVGMGFLLLEGPGPLMVWSVRIPPPPTATKNSTKSRVEAPLLWHFLWTSCAAGELLSFASPRILWFANDFFSS